MHIHTDICDFNPIMVEYSPIARETRVQYLVQSYQRLKKMVLDICHCLPPERTRHKVNDPKAD